MRTGLASIAALAVGLLFVVGAKRIVERQQTATEINRLREELYRLQTSEASLRGLGLTIDSLRSRVDSLESMDGRGVPADRYQEYLGVFDQYNDSVAAWEGRERRLRTTESACRATIEEHNALSDSLQAVLADAGIEAG
jgi:hypothetical protein